MRIVKLASGLVWEVAPAGTIVMCKDRMYIGGILRNPTVGMTPLVTLIGDDSVTLNTTIQEIDNVLDDGTPESEDGNAGVHPRLPKPAGRKTSKGAVRR